jgi:hypothetical protein
MDEVNVVNSKIVKKINFIIKFYVVKIELTKLFFHDKDQLNY